LSLIPTGFAIAVLVYHKILNINKENLLLLEGVAFSCGAICVLVYFMSPVRNWVLWLLAASFIFSIAGDLFLKKRASDIKFTLGIFFFLLAHIGYFIYAVKNVKFSWLVFTIVTIPYLIFYFTSLLPSSRLKNSGLLAFTVFLYTIMSCVTFSAAFNPMKNRSVSSWVFAAGITSLLISDTLISAGSFLQFRKLSFLIMPLYYLCHILIVLSVTLKQMYQE